MYINTDGQLTNNINTYKINNFKRLIARIIDAVIFIVTSIGLFTLLIFITESFKIESPSTLNTIIGLTFLILFVFLDLFFGVIIPGFIFKTQTIGKKVAGLKIITSDGNNSSFLKLLARWFIFQIISVFGLGLFLIILPILLSQKKQGVHDMIVDTYVVEVE